MALSLYAPHVAKFLSYAQCVAVVLVDTDKKTCDCNLAASTNKNTNDALPHQASTINFKADWQLTTTEKFKCCNDGLLLQSIKQLHYQAALLNGFCTAVFHPPCC